jgi:Na+-driven multidrug efflux pump
VGILFIGQDILILIYRNPSFAQATTALNIVTMGLIASSYTRPLSYVLVANGFEQINLIEVLITSVLGGLLSIFMVEKYQLNGAAIANLSMQIIACFIYIYYVYKRLFSLQIWRTIRRPIIVSTLMLVVFVVLQNFSLNILVKMLAATLSYCLIVGSIAIYALGGFSAVWEKFLLKKRS